MVQRYIAAMRNIETMSQHGYFRGFYRSLIFASYLLFLILQSVNAQEESITVDTPGTQALPVPVPLAAERNVAPIPERFSWITRENPSNSLLESLLDLREGPTNLLLSLSLLGEYTDNFSRSANTVNNGTSRGEGEEYRTLLNIGTVYRLEKEHGFLSLANSFGTSYRFKAEESDIAFANLNFTAGYDFPRLSLALHESFIRDNDLNSDSLRTDPSVGLLRQREPFLRNSIGPQIRYTLSRTSIVRLGYTYIVTLRENSDNELTSSHSASVGFDQNFSKNLSMSVNYSFTTTDDNINQANNNGRNSSATRVHSPSLQFDYATDRRTTLFLQGMAKLSRRDSPNADSFVYGAALGIKRVLTPYLMADIALGPQIFETESQARQVFPAWQVDLHGDLPFLRAHPTRLTLRARQSIDDTSTEVNDVGFTLRRSVALTLSHTLSQRLHTSFFLDYTRTEILQDVGTVESSDGRIDNLWNAGTQVSYILTRTFSLSASYRHQQRLSNIADSDFTANIVTIIFSSSLPVF